MKQERIYLAAPYERRFWLVEKIAPLLRDWGHHITSSWINDPAGNDHVADYLRARRRGAAAVNPQYDGILAHEAMRDELDVYNSTMLMRFPNPDGSISGGRFHETGFARGSQRAKVVVIGNRESVFDYIPQVLIYPDFETAVEALGLTV